MFSKSQKLQLKRDEQFRAEVRQRLGKGETQQSKVWKFLNSSFGLWLLSALLVTGAGNWYTRYQSRRAEEAGKLEQERVESIKDQELVDQLDYEIGHRISQTLIELYGLTDFENKRTSLAPGHTTDEIDRVIRQGLLEPPSKGDFVLYPDFAKYSCLALIAELRRLLSRSRSQLDKAKAAEVIQGLTHDIDVLGRALASLSGLPVPLREMKGSPNVQARATLILENLGLDRWRNSEFYFTDCRAESPFC